MVTLADINEVPLNPCPACGGTKWEDAGKVKDYSITGEWFELRVCPLCQLKATYPQPGKAEIGRYYASESYISHSDTKTGLINRLYHAAREYMLKKKHNWVEKASHLKSGNLLDIGAGTGHFSHFMQSRGWQVTALEPDEKARTIAIAKLGLNIKPLEELDHQPEHFYDVITLWHVLEHVHDLGVYMDHFRTILKPGGTLVIAVPNHTSRDARKYEETWAAYDVPRHLWHFSPASMDKLLSRHQFSLVEKIPMHLDAFYVSMLSEKYRGNDLSGSVKGFISGFQTFLDSRGNVDEASSVIYIAR